MKRLAFIIGGVSLSTWGMSGALTACGGDDGVAPIDSDAGNTSSSGSSSSGAASSSGGSPGGDPGDAGPGDGGGDGGADGGGGAEGGVQSNPSKITCGAVECTVGTQICCRPFTGDAGCIADNENCGGGGAEIECDEKADCPNNEVCCGSSFNQDLRCESANACDGVGDFSACKTNAECAGIDGGTCKEWSCPGSRKIRSCVLPFQGCN